jgi:thymidine phosphorylase
VAGLRVGTGAPGLAGVAGVVTVRLTWASVTGLPLRVSPSSTSRTLGCTGGTVDARDTLSGSAAIAAATTVTEMVAVWQLLGLSASQMV